MSELIDSHDHGNCELCDKLEAQNAKFRAALEEIKTKHFPCENEPWCIARVAEEALGPEGGTNE